MNSEMRLSPIVVVLLVAFLAVPSTAEIRVHRNLTVAAGLAQSQVLSLAADREGALWVGTNDGASRWDGAAFTTLQSRDGVPAGPVYAIAPRPDGTVWFATANGVAWFRGGRIERAPAASGLAASPVVAIAALGSGDLLFLRPDRWVERRVNGSWVPFGPLAARTSSHRPWRSLLADRNGRIWIGGTGVLVLDDTGHLTESVPELGGRRIASITEAPDRALLFATDRGLARWACGKLSWLTSEETTSVAVALDGAIFAGTPSSGALVWTSPDQVPERIGVEQGLASNRVSAVLASTSGAVVFGTDDGASLWDRGRVATWTAADGLPERSIWAFAEDGHGGFWVGGDGGLARREGGRFQPVSGLPRVPVRSLVPGAPGRLFAGTQGDGLWEIDIGEGREHLLRVWTDRDGLPDRFVRALAQDVDGALWIGTPRGLAVLRGGRIEPGPAPLDRADVYALSLDAAGGLRVAAADGVFGLEGGRVRSFGGMPARPGLAFLAGPLPLGRSVWVGTSGGLGLLRGGRIERVAVAGGLGNETINCLAADPEGRLFASTNRGVEVLRPSGSGLSAADRLTSADGLPSGEGDLGACFRDARGRLWFGSIGGAAEVDPARIVPRPPPRVAWTGANLGGLPVALPSTGTPLHLAPGAGSLALSWIGVDVATPEAVIYQTRFAGLDAAWTLTDRRTVQLASPAPGSYRFEVRAARRGGEWSPTLALDLVAEAPLWRRGWFRAAVALALLALVGTLAAWRVRQLLAIERLRTEIAADLHDHVGAGLTEIAILAEIAGRRAAQPNPSKESRGPDGSEGAPEIARAAETARGLIDRMDDIVWLVNPRRDSLHELFVRLKDSYAELFSAQGVLFRATNLRLFEGVRLPMAQRENLLAIFREALANALRHSGCREIELDVSLRRRTLEVTLRDDGTGFDPAKVKEGDGLSNMKARAAKIGGKLAVESAEGHGTTVRFRGPIG
jgi:signal transduction histidine kinase/ligand-binding sensor domain-containing protein